MRRTIRRMFFRKAAAPTQEMIPMPEHVLRRVDEVRGGIPRAVWIKWAVMRTLNEVDEPEMREAATR